jgi:nucleotide-binding universal stress UspA family protein
VQSILENELKARATGVLGTSKFATHIQANWGRPDAALAEMAESAGADLIVVGSHQYHGFDRLWHASVSRGLLHHSKVNVVVVPLRGDHV